MRALAFGAFVALLALVARCQQPPEAPATSGQPPASLPLPLPLPLSLEQQQQQAPSYQSDSHQAPQAHASALHALHSAPTPSLSVIPSQPQQQSLQSQLQSQALPQMLPQQTTFAAPQLQQQHQHHQQQQHHQHHQQQQQPQQQPQQQAKYKTKVACEDSMLTIECENGHAINLIRANYGRFSLTTCNDAGQLDMAIDCMSPISFRVMKERCQSQRRCSVNATNAMFGNKCPRTPKYLEVHYQCAQTEIPYVNLLELPPHPSSSQFPPLQPMLPAATQGLPSQLLAPASSSRQPLPASESFGPYSHMFDFPSNAPHPSGSQQNNYLNGARPQQPFAPPSVIEPSDSQLQQLPSQQMQPTFNPLCPPNEQQQIEQQQANAPSSSLLAPKRLASASTIVTVFVYFVATVVCSVAVFAAVLSMQRSSLLRGVFNHYYSDASQRTDDSTLHNKDLLVINNQNGHQFLYTPASSTKISNHMLTAPSSPSSHHQFSAALNATLANQHHQQQHQHHGSSQHSFGGSHLPHDLLVNSSPQHSNIAGQHQHHGVHHQNLLATSHNQLSQHQFLARQPQTLSQQMQNNDQMYASHNQIYSSLVRGSQHSSNGTNTNQSNYYCYVKN